MTAFIKETYSKVQKTFNTEVNIFLGWGVGMASVSEPSGPRFNSQFFILLFYSYGADIHRPNGTAKASF